MGIVRKHFPSSRNRIIERAKAGLTNGGESSLDTPC
jgi:hypothetical protein